MEFAYYSMCVVIGFAITRWVTENFKFHVRSERFWLHHWIISLIAMIALIVADVGSELVWGGLTGVALEGLGRKNWSISRK